MVNNVMRICKQCMNKEIENLIRKSMVKDIEIKMLDKELDGLIISKEIVLEILRDLTENIYPDSFKSESEQIISEDLKN